MMIAGGIVAYLLTGYLFAVWANAWDGGENTPGMLLTLNTMWPLLVPFVVILMICEWWERQDWQPEIGEKIKTVYRIKK